MIASLLEFSLRQPILVIGLAISAVGMYLMSTLGADATPVIVERLPAEMASCLTASASSGPFQTDDWLAWNLGRSRAATARDSLASTGVDPSDTSCAAYQTDDYRP